MTQKDKELLIKDISCRIPYGVIVNVNGISNVKLISVSWYEEVGVDDGSTCLYHISEVKPYLLPLSSMSEEQKEELNRVTNGKFNSYGTYIDNCKPRNWSEWGTTEYNWIRHHDVDLLHTWLNKNHFDYRGLIEKGLTIDATGLNIY